MNGIGVSPGRARGPAVLLSTAGRGRSIDDPVGALGMVADELEQLASPLRGELRDILMAQASIARDPELSTAIREASRSGRPPAEALRLGAEPFREALAGARSEYQRERAADLTEVVGRAARRLEGTGQPERTPPVPGILVGPVVSPADTATVPLDQLLGIVSADGGAKSHVAIVARSLGIPAVSGVDPSTLAALCPGQWIEIDGTCGTIEVFSDEQGGSTFSAKSSDSDEHGGSTPSAKRAGSDEHHHDCRPADSSHDIRANIGSLAEAELACRMGIGSAGLIRTEFLLPDQRALEVDRQVEVYRELLAQLPGELVFRLLDLGADKPHPAVPTPAAPNPALGLRGARLLLRHPALLEDQLEALCRLGEPDRVAILVPMVTRVAELRAVRALAERAFARLGVRLPLGSMIEVPAAALAARELAAESDFISVGTNDLLQYLFAADRGVTELDSLVEPLPAATWRLLGEVMQAARCEGTPVGICGELAADPELAGALLALGADYISMGPAAAPAVRSALASKTPEEWLAVAEQLCGHPLEGPR
jgi:phosphoenolpyruvate-protein kinase (PTS system EI component)